MYDKIRKLAKEKGFSIPSIEEATGLSNGAISKWNISSPSVDNLKKVADFLGVTMEDLMSDTETAP